MCVFFPSLFLSKNVSYRMVHVIAMEVLPEERDRKYYADSYSCCPPPLFILLITIIEVRFYLNFAHHSQLLDKHEKSKPTRDSLVLENGMMGWNEPTMTLKCVFCRYRWCSAVSWWWYIVYSYQERPYRITQPIRKCHSMWIHKCHNQMEFLINQRKKEKYPTKHTYHIYIFRLFDQIKMWNFQIQ